MDNRPTALSARRAALTVLACAVAVAWVAGSRGEAASANRRAGQTVGGAGHFPSHLPESELSSLPPVLARWVAGWQPGAAGRALGFPDEVLWEAVPVQAEGGLMDVATVSASEAWAVSLGSSDIPAEVLRFRDGAWEVVYGQTGRYLWSISMVSADDGWAAGFDVDPVKSVLPPIRDGVVGDPVFSECGALITVQMHDSAAGWAGGNFTVGGVSSSCMLRYSNGSWERAPSPGGALVSALALTSPDDGWAIGSEGAILRLVGGQWQTAQSPFPGPVSGWLYYDASLAAPGNGWAVGTNAAQTLRLVGDAWRIEDIGLPVSLFGVDMLDAELGWAVGGGPDQSPAVLRFDGQRWIADELPTGATTPLTRVDMASANVGWAVGGTTAIRRLDDPAPTATASATPSPIATDSPTPTATSTATAAVDHAVHLPWAYAK